MSTPMLIDVSDEALRKAEQVAGATGHSLAEVLSDTVDSGLLLVERSLQARLPLSQISDDETLALADLMMDPQQAERLSELLDKQQAGLIVASERIELERLSCVYDDALIRKSEGMAEAVRRGLRPPVES